MSAPEVTVVEPGRRSPRAATGRLGRLRSGRLHGRGMAFGAGTVLALVVVLCVAAPVISPYDPTAIDPKARFAAPSWDHLAGTDELGRDIFTRVLYGGRFALLLAVSATIAAIILGGIWGAAAALRGGWVDEVLMRVADATLAVPTFLLALMALAAMGVSPLSLVITLGLLQAPWTARVLRAVCAQEMRSDYCVAATAFGSSRIRLLFKEILPNAIPTILVQANVVLASSLILEASLSFVGLGVQPPQASWGTLVLDGYKNLYSATTYIIAPVLAICVTTSALNLLADELQGGEGG